MQCFVVADADGVIQQAMFSVGQTIAPAVDGMTTVSVSREVYDAVVNFQSHYRVAGGEVIERDILDPTIIGGEDFAADGVSECVISGLPSPCVVTIRGVVTAGPSEVTGGTVTLTTTEPGAITVHVEADPTHKPWRWSVNAA